MTTTLAPIHLADMCCCCCCCSKHQEHAVHVTRASLLNDLRKVASEWQQLLPVLALELLQISKDQWHMCGTVKSVIRNLAQEREAVLSFLYTVCDEVSFMVLRSQLQLLIVLRSAYE